MKKILNLLTTITDKVIIAKANKKNYIELTIEGLDIEQAQLIADYVNIALECDIDVSNHRLFVIYIEG